MAYIACFSYSGYYYILNIYHILVSDRLLLDKMAQVGQELGEQRLGGSGWGLRSQRSGLGPQREILCVISATFISSLSDHDKLNKQTN
jgi:hypothetical protein